jgi:hypothetical protein
MRHPKIFLFFILIIFISFFSCRSKGARNKYREAKVRPSEKMMAEDKKVMKKAKRTYQKRMRHNRKHLFGRSRAPKD